MILATKRRVGGWGDCWRVSYHEDHFGLFLLRWSSLREVSSGIKTGEGLVNFKIILRPGHVLLRWSSIRKEIRGWAGEGLVTLKILRSGLLLLRWFSLKEENRGMTGEGLVTLKIILRSSWDDPHLRRWVFLEVWFPSEEIILTKEGEQGMRLVKG